MADRILILGASARAAAASARRAGYEPFVIDLFADRDTQSLADCLRCPLEAYPHGLFRLARQAPRMPWMYTGGLENAPELIDALAQERPLWGNGSAVLCSVRNPFSLAARCSEKGIAYPALYKPDRSATPSGVWLRKPLRGSGGIGIRFAAAADFNTPDADHILQQFLPGASGSALFWAEHPHAVVCGCSRQLIGTDWLHAGPFQYAGSIVQSVDADSEIVRAACHFASECGLRGLFGIDYIHHRDQTVLVEVNPRYTASVEVIELATQRACWNMEPHRESARSAHSPLHRTVGKAIYFAPHRLTIPTTGPWDDALRHATDVWRRPDYADIPHPGAVIDQGQPVLTLFAEAENATACQVQLRMRAAEVDQLFGYIPDSGATTCPQ